MNITINYNFTGAFGFSDFYTNCGGSTIKQSVFTGQAKSQKTRS